MPKCKDVKIYKRGFIYLIVVKTHGQENKRGFKVAFQMLKALCMDWFCKNCETTIAKRG